MFERNQDLGPKKHGTPFSEKRKRKPQGEAHPGPLDLRVLRHLVEDHVQGYARRDASRPMGGRMPSWPGETGSRPPREPVWPGNHQGGRQRGHQGGTLWGLLFGR